jgi:hypothetical protein
MRVCFSLQYLLISLLLCAPLLVARQTLNGSSLRTLGSSAAVILLLKLARNVPWHKHDVLLADVGMARV